MSEDSKKTYRTAARTGIIEFLRKNADKTVTVNDIMEGLHNSELEINVSTVYRYLGKLVEEGVINKYVADKGEMAVYQYSGVKRNCNEHIHMQCKKCGRVIHLECDFMDEFSEHILKHHGFEIVCKGSILFGRCEKCRESACK